MIYSSWTEAYTALIGSKAGFTPNQSPASHRINRQITVTPMVSLESLIKITSHRCHSVFDLNIEPLHHLYTESNLTTHLPFVSTLITQTLYHPIYSITSWFASYRAAITMHAYIINSKCTITRQWETCPASNFLLPFAAGNTINQAPKPL